MKYHSTRGDGQQELSFEDTVLTGLAPDGGLYIPTSIPSLPEDWETVWSDLSFQDLALEVLSLYIDPQEISRAELKALVQRSYSTFRHPDITPLRQLRSGEGDERGAGALFVLELFHGPTFAFKDVALQFLGNLFEFFLARKNARLGPGEKRKHLTVVGATSGDTGSAAIYGLRGKKDIDIFILHPKDRISPIQEAQMTSVMDENVHNIALDSTFDDCQDIVKALFANSEFNAAHQLGAINSINWARILAQTVYYFCAYFHARRLLSPDGKKESRLQFVVPTGNFGDVLAGYYARRMGLPMAQLVIATNENDILTRFWRTGRYEKVDADADAAAVALDGCDAGAVRETWSPAMDILVSSNFERLLWYLAYENAETNDEIGEIDGNDERASCEEDNKRRAACTTVADWMSHVKADGRVELPSDLVALARRDFVAERVSNDETIETIRAFYETRPSYIADPHTAVGLAAAQLVAPHSPPSTAQIVLSTAHPAKFGEAVSRALRFASRPKHTATDVDADADAAADADAPSSSSKFNFERDVLPAEFRGLLERPRRMIDLWKPEVERVQKLIEKFARAREHIG